MDRAPVIVDDAPCLGETEPKASARLAAGVEGVENMWSHIIGNAWARVANDNTRPA